MGNKYQKENQKLLDNFSPQIIKTSENYAPLQWSMKYPASVERRWLEINVFLRIMKLEMFLKIGRNLTWSPFYIYWKIELLLKFKKDLKDKIKGLALKHCSYINYYESFIYVILFVLVPRSNILFCEFRD